MQNPSTKAVSLFAARPALALAYLVCALLLVAPLSTAALGPIPGANPPKITDLTAEQGDGPTEVNLAWTIPAEAEYYDIRYNTVVVTDANWDDCVEVENPPDPGDPGNTETFTVGGLAPGDTYYFGVVSRDSGLRPSQVSNSPGALPGYFVLHFPMLPVDETGTFPGGTGVAVDAPPSRSLVRVMVVNDSADTIYMKLEGNPFEVFYYLTEQPPKHQTVTVPADGTLTVQPSDTPDGTAHRGSVVMYSERQLVATSLIQVRDPAGAIYGQAAVQGQAAGSNTVHLPSMICDAFGGQTSYYAIQNTSFSDSASVSVTFYDKDGSVAGSDSATLGPGASTFRDLTAGSGTGTNCDTLANMSGAFHGAAIIESDTPIVATVLQAADSDGAQKLSAYNGIPNGSNKVKLPVIQARGFGVPNYTGIAIQNVGSEEALVTIDYSENRQGGSNPVQETVSIPAGGVRTVSQSGDSGQNDWNSIGAYAGAATVKCTTPVVVAVQEKDPANTTTAAYAGIVAYDSTSKVLNPLFTRSQDGTYATHHVGNISYDKVNLRCKYPPSQDDPLPQDDVYGLPESNDWRGIGNSGMTGYDGGVNNWQGVGDFQGSVTCESNGGPIVAVTKLNMNPTGVYSDVVVAEDYNGVAVRVDADPKTTETMPKIPGGEQASQGAGVLDSVEYTYLLFNDDYYRLTDFTVTPSQGTAVVWDDVVGPFSLGGATGTYSVTAEQAGQSGPLVNEILVEGKRSDGQVVSYMAAARIGLPKLYDVDPAQPLSVTVMAGDVVFEGAAGAIPAGGAYLRYTDHGTEPFVDKGAGLPSSTVNFVKAFGLALVDAGEQIIEAPQFDPPLTLTVTYSQTVVDGYALNEGDLLVVWYDSVAEEWKTVADVERDGEADTITFAIDELVGNTEFGLVDGTPLPPPFPQAVFKVYLPMIMRP